MKYIVTGACGFIGSYLTNRLLNNGHQVVALDDLSSGKRKYIPQDHPNLTFLYCDISDWRVLLGNVDHFKDVQGIFSLAAIARIQEAISNPRRCNEVNVLGTFNMLELMRNHNIPKIVFSSSSSIYGLKNNPPQKEDMKPDCLNPYSLSKLIGEKYIKIYCDLYGINGVSLRYFNVFGPREVVDGPYGTVVGKFFKQVLGDKTPITIVGNGSQSRDFTYVEDVVDANLKAMQYSGHGEVFNVGSGYNYTVEKVANMILENLNKPGYKVYIPPRPAEAYATLADISRAKELLGWEPKYNLEKKLLEERDYYESFYNTKKV